MSTGSGRTIGGIAVSPVGMGCAAMLGRVGRAESLAALGAALDAGITFFDTARSYGFGDSEGLLGEFLSGRRDQVLLCTKFGILPGARGGWKQRVKPLAQAVVGKFPALMKVAKRAAAGELSHGNFSVDVLRTSFETSLRELRTDHVDLLLMHAAPVSVLAQDDLLDAMRRLAEQGKARMIGISGDSEMIHAALETRPPGFSTLQFALNVNNLALTAETARPQHRDLLLVANHPFGGPAGVQATRARVEAMRSSEHLPASLREKLTPGDPQLMPEIVLNAILRGTGVDAVIPAMMQLRHIQGNLRAVTHCRFTDEEIAIIRAALIAGQVSSS